jgi:hypothetical protein
LACESDTTEQPATAFGGKLGRPSRENIFIYKETADAQSLPLARCNDADLQPELAALQVSCFLKFEPISALH